MKIDAAGIYHGHSRGVTKYSLDNGRQEWHLDTGEAVYDGVKVCRWFEPTRGHVYSLISPYCALPNLAKQYSQRRSKQHHFVLILFLISY